MSINSILKAILAFSVAFWADEEGGFVVDMITGGSKTQSGNPITPVSSPQAAADYQRLIQAVKMQQGMAQGMQPGMNAGQDAQIALLAALQQQAAGGGPNPAMGMLNNATGANVAQTAALMGGQRGASGNAGMMARQIGQAGAGIQQDAAGQAAVMQAQQQLAAQQALGAQAGQMVGQGQQAVGQFNAAAMQPLQFLGQQNTAGIQNAAQMNNTEASKYGNNLDLFGKTIGAAGAATGVSGKAHGGVIDEGEALVPGDSELNDVVPTLLSPGEIVVPRSMASDPKSASAFAYAVAMMSKRKGK